MKINIDTEIKKSVYQQSLETNYRDLFHSLSMVGLDPDAYDTEEDLPEIEAILSENDPTSNNIRFYYERIIQTSKTINLIINKLNELNG